LYKKTVLTMFTDNIACIAESVNSVRISKSREIRKHKKLEMTATWYI